jgi:hypothetical protein
MVEKGALLVTRQKRSTSSGWGTRLFDGVPKSYRLDLVSSTASSNGILELQYRRHR